MSDTADKAKLRFEVRSQKDPKDTTKTIFVPAIVERADPMQLSKVVYNAINEGRIAGLKPNAAKSIAEGICDQMYEELKEGTHLGVHRRPETERNRRQVRYLLQSRLDSDRA